MSTNTNDRFLNYYTNELTYLRQAGSAFAQNYPKIARRLELSDKESSDPHTERLLESFAFLTARLSQEIDNRFPESASALLQVLYPHLVNPIPSMAIAHFQIDPSKGKTTKPYTIDKHTSLYSYAAEDVACRFSTVYPVTLWPLELTHVDFVHNNHVRKGDHSASGQTWYLKLSLKAFGDATIASLNMDELVFHIKGERQLTYMIYESLFAQPSADLYAHVPGDDHFAKLPKGSVMQMGFLPHEMTLPIPPHGTHAFLLMQEFFHFPEKFMFFKLSNLGDMKKHLNLATNTLELYVSLSDIGTLLDKNVTKKNFLLGCTPIVNLFQKTTDPLRLDRRKNQYRLIPDQRRDKTFEIHTIQSVMSAVESSDQVKTFAPYFSLQHHHDDNQIFWYAKRVSAELRGVPGADMMISFVDLKFDPSLPPTNIVYANTLCTNRYLAEQIPSQAEFQLDDAASVSRIVCLDKPTKQSYSPMDGDSLWRMVSILSTNHLTLMGTDSALETLKERLVLHAGTSHHKERLMDIEAIQSVTHKPIVRRIGNESWRGFVRGVEIHIKTNRPAFKGSSSFLLSAILQHYFAITVSMNSFVEVVLTGNDHEGEWMRWPAQRGIKTLL